MDKPNYEFGMDDLLQKFNVFVESIEQNKYVSANVAYLGRQISNELLSNFCKESKIELIPIQNFDQVITFTSKLEENAIQYDVPSIDSQGEIFENIPIIEKMQNIGENPETILYKIIQNKKAIYVLIYTWYYHATGEDTCLYISYPKDETKEVHSFLTKLKNYIAALTKDTNKIYVLPGGSFIDRPNVSLDSIILPKSIKNDILLNMENFFGSKEIYKKLGVPCKRGFLFIGPPGNGKTSLCRAIASEFDIPFCYVTLGRQDQRNFTWKSIFTNVRKMTPCILLIEDLDRVLENSQDETQTFLNALDGFESLDEILIIATANDASKIDTALIDRPSRFDRVWKFELPDEDLREEFLLKFSKDLFSKEVFKKAATATKGFSFAYLKEVVINSLLNAANENRDPKDDDLMNSVELLDRQMKKIKANFEDTMSVGFKQKKATALDIMDPIIKLPRRKK